MPAQSLQSEGLCAGSLNRRVTLQKPVAEFVGGERQITWVDVATVWASVAPLSAREYILAKQTQADVTHRVRLRYRPDMHTTWRVVYAGRAMNIAGPPRDVDSAHVMTELLVMEQPE